MHSSDPLTAKTLETTAVALLILAACSADSDVAPLSRPVSADPGKIPGRPSPNPRAPDLAYLEVCKDYPAGIVGPTVTISFDIDHLNDGTIANHCNFNLRAGSCEDIYVNGGFSPLADNVTVTVTEHVPAGYLASYVSQTTDATAVSTTTITGANGDDLFSNLPQGSYTVAIGTPTGFNPTTSSAAGGNSGNDSNGSAATVSLATNSSSDLTIEFGFVAVRGNSCTLTQGYWKNHTEDWDQLSDGKLFLATSPFYNSGLTYITILNTPPKGGNAYIQLADQFIAARLNTNGALTGIASVDAALAGGVTYVANAPAGIPRPTGAQRTQLQAWATVLDDFNNGKLGLPHC